MQHRTSHAPVFKLHPVQLPVEPPLDEAHDAVCALITEQRMSYILRTYRPS